MNHQTTTQVIVDRAIATVAEKHGLHIATVQAAMFEEPNGAVARDVSDLLVADFAHADGSFGFLGHDAEGMAVYYGPAI